MCPRDDSAVSGYHQSAYGDFAFSSRHFGLLQAHLHIEFVIHGNKYTFDKPQKSIK
ncbi:MAG TPA: hypothetical protein VGJ94_13870 [Syntrophorhabdaceae bacterium]